MIRIGVLGCGAIGIKHLLALQSLQQQIPLTVTAIADAGRKALNRSSEIWPAAKAYLNARELIENEHIDLLYICLPSYLHTKYAVMAMRRRIGVFIEKPVCLTAAEAELLLAEQERNNAFAAVGQVLRFFAEYDYLYQLIRTGIYGELQFLTMNRRCGRAEAWFQAEEKSGSVVLDLHIHDVDFIRYAIGEPELKRVIGRAGNTGIITHIMTEYACGGIRAVAEGLWDISGAIPFAAGYRAYFEKATVVYDSARVRTPVIYEAGQVVEGQMDGGSPYQKESQYLLTCFLNKQEPVRISLAEGIKSVAVCRQELAMAKQFVHNNFSGGCYESRSFS